MSKKDQSNSKVQATLSKFFSSFSRGNTVKTDKEDTFEIEPDRKSKKRHQTKDDKEESVPKEKKICHDQSKSPKKRSSDGNEKIESDRKSKKRHESKDDKKESVHKEKKNCHDQSKSSKKSSDGNKKIEPDRKSKNRHEAKDGKEESKHKEKKMCHDQNNSPKKKSSDGNEKIEPDRKSKNRHEAKDGKEESKHKEKKMCHDQSKSPKKKSSDGNEKNDPDRKSKKRHETKDDKEESVPKEKKICRDERVKSPKKTSSDGKGKVSNSGKKSQSDPQKGNDNCKLTQFDYDEDAMGGSQERQSFVSQNCYEIDFSCSTNGTANESSQLDKEAEEGSSSSIVSSKVESKSSYSTSLKSLSQFKKGQSGPKYTPLEQQFVEIKAENTDTLLFVECGYKYRFFGDDAEIAAKTLNITCHLDHSFMTASIPAHRLFVHIRRLVAAGYKVGIVKQTETAHVKAAGDNKSAPFTRKLTDLYTKSTLIGEDVDPVSTVNDDSDAPVLKASSYLMCLHEASKVTGNKEKREIGLVCVDPATGDIVYDHFSDGDSFSELETRIAHLQPVEVLISDNAPRGVDKIVSDIAAMSVKDDRIRVERLDNKTILSPSEAVSKMSEFYAKDAKSLQVVLNLPKSVLICLTSVIAYLKHFKLDGILSMTSNFQEFTSKAKHMHLNSQCLSNLEVFNNSFDGSESGSLFSVLNHTKTRFGTRLLKRWIAQPLLDESEIHQRLDAVEEINSGKMPDLKTTSTLLSRLPDVERGLCSIFYKKSSPLEFYNVTHALERVRKHFFEYRKLASCQITSSLILSLINEIPDFLEDVGAYSTSINESAAKTSDKANLFVDESQFPSIMERKKEISEVITELRDHRKEVRLTLKQPGLEFVSVNQVEFLIPVKNSMLKTVPSAWTNISSTKQVTRFHSPFIIKKYRKLNELRERLVADVISAWQSFLGDFSSHYVKYRKAVKCLATLDCLMSLAKTSLQGTFCKPDISPDNVEIHIEQGRHPILDSLNDEQYMPNNTDLSADGLRVMVISGPNMGGKSSYIRQVALITIMAQVGCFVPAESAKMGILDAVYTRMGANDRIFQGQSTFMVELQEASEIISHATPRSLVILDELGRGTSTHDGVAIAHATLKHFITETKSLVLFVTHFPMMLEFHTTYPGIVDNFHMSFFMNQSDDTDPENTDIITFLYQLTQGAAEKSYGLNVARLADVSSSIIQKASKKSQELENKILKRITRRETFNKLWASEVEEILPLIQEQDKS